MATSARRARERTVLYLSTPALWPHWLFLPVVRRTSGHEELGVVFDRLKDAFKRRFDVDLRVKA